MVGAGLAVIVAVAAATLPGGPGPGPDPTPGSSTPSATATGPGPSPTPGPTGTDPTATPDGTPVASEPPPPDGLPAGFILVPAEVLAGLPTTGAGWDGVVRAAAVPADEPDISDQNDPTDVIVLAKALVHARTGDPQRRDEVREALVAVIGTEDGSRTLALGRNIPGYVLAADLIELSTFDARFDEEAFRPWLQRLLSGEFRTGSIRSTHEDRPNNWGTHAGAARAAIAAYLGDEAEFARTAAVFRAYLGDRTVAVDFRFGDDLSWQCDPAAPVGVNPAGCTRDGVELSGSLPEEMRRGDSFRWPPTETGYPWEALQGALLQAELLDRGGYDPWAWEDRAILRAAEFLYRIGWRPSGDDSWQPWLLDARYGTSFHTDAPITSGKNFGFTDWLYGPPGS